jgi:hypothetical protein
LSNEHSNYLSFFDVVGRDSSEEEKAKAKVLDELIEKVLFKCYIYIYY